jgi:hypothetical protein
LHARPFRVNAIIGEASALQGGWETLHLVLRDRSGQAGPAKREEGSPRWRRRSLQHTPETM